MSVLRLAIGSVGLIVCGLVILHLPGRNSDSLRYIKVPTKA